MVSVAKLEDLAKEKIDIFRRFIAAEPPRQNGESLLDLWRDLYDEAIRSIVVETTTGPSDDVTNPVFPYEKLYAVIGDGGNWKWPRMWQHFDELERRGPAYREGEKLHFQQPNKNTGIVPQRVLVVGGGPVGLRLSIELLLGGHKVTIFEKRREARSETGELEKLGFTNRINRPHMWPFVRHDLAKLNGKDFMSRQAAYPVFTEPDTSSIGIDELQVLLLKTALLLGVDFLLGVGYEDAKVQTDPETMRPSWDVVCCSDETAAQQFGLTVGRSNMTFDVLMGCDGPRSTVRETQTRWLGDIEKRKFMDCVGIVANVRKVSRPRLRQLGFDSGLEPKDMNRTKMVFKQFFDRIKSEADAELENLIYYKASFHNYAILTPKRADLIRHGLSGKVYHHTLAREPQSGKDEEKAKLKAYCGKVLHAAGIPLDEELENDGFVEAPNDVMAFDFAECWNTKRSIQFNLPPLDYNVAEHGAWSGRPLCPMVGLAGDSLLEPFWPMGLGLKRGWQAIMDACYAIDNLYNKAAFASKWDKVPANVSWEEHHAALKEQVEQNFEFCNRLKVGEDLGKGEYSENGLVMQQLRKRYPDAEKPPYEVEIDPWTRYGPLEQQREQRFGRLSRDNPAWLHPRVQKALAMKSYYEETAKAGGAQGEIVYRGKKLLGIQGEEVAASAEYRPPGLKSASDMAAFGAASSLPSPKKPAIPEAEVLERSLQKRNSLVSSVMGSKIDEHVQRGMPSPGIAFAAAAVARQRAATAASSTLEDPRTRDELGLVPPEGVGDSVAAASEAMWDRMHEKHLSPAQEAELAHIRHMIDALSRSLESYREAEKALLMSMRK